MRKMCLRNKIQNNFNLCIKFQFKLIDGDIFDFCFCLFAMAKINFALIFRIM